MDTPRWPDGHRAAVTFTFDDGHQAHADELAPLFATHNIPVTFYVVTNWVGGDGKATWDHWRDVAATGHEIGNHSASHATLPGLSPERLEHEIVTSAATISEHIGRAPASFAYPFCKHDENVRQLVFTHHTAARAYYPLLEGRFNRETATARVRTGIEREEWVVWLSHGLDAAVLEAHLTTDLAPLANDLWFATFAQASAWQRARDAAGWQITDNTITLSLPEHAETDLITLQARISGIPDTARFGGALIGDAQRTGDAWLVSVPAQNGAVITIE